MRFEQGNGNFSEGATEVPPIVSYFDSTANDSDKTWTVPDGEMWMLNWAHAILVATATVGNRVVTIDIEDGEGNLLIDIPSAANHTANNTEHYAFFQGIYRETAFAAGAIQVPIPKDLYLKAGYTLRIYDRGAIAPEADDLTVSFQIKRFKGC